MDVQKVRVRNSNRSSPVFNNCTMHLWWPQVRRLSGKKIFFKVRESQGISLRVRENLSLGKKSGKSEILRVHNYSFSSTFVEIRWYILRAWIMLYW